MTFSRNAASLKDAILSAIRDVQNANIGALVLRVDTCNVVTQADIARKIGRTRQLVHQYITGQRGPGGFPAPVCNITDGVPLWFWCEVAYWLRQNDMISHDPPRKPKRLPLSMPFWRCAIAHRARTQRGDPPVGIRRYRGSSRPERGSGQPAPRRRSDKTPPDGLLVHGGDRSRAVKPRRQKQERPAKTDLVGCGPCYQGHGG